MAWKLSGQDVTPEREPEPGIPGASRRIKQETLPEKHQGHLGSPQCPPEGDLTIDNHKHKEPVRQERNRYAQGDR